MKKKLNIVVSGNGAEMVIGLVDKTAVEYFELNEIDLDDYSQEQLFKPTVPKKYRPFEPGEWYECDHITHENGPYLDTDNEIVIQDEAGNIVYKSKFDIRSLKKSHAKVTRREKIRISDINSDEDFFVCESTACGEYYDVDIEIEGEFDPSKLCISYSDVEGTHIVQSIDYDGEEISGEGLSTYGKYFDSQFVISNSKKVKLHDFNDSELTDWYPCWSSPFLNPVYDGAYEVQVSVDGLSCTFARWQKNNFYEIQSLGEPEPINGVPMANVFQWRGLNSAVIN